jgi:hypothetical protein
MGFTHLEGIMRREIQTFDKMLLVKTSKIIIPVFRMVAL